MSININKLYYDYDEVENMSCVKEICDYAALHFPDKTAYVQYMNKQSSKEITFKKLAEEVNALRRGLISIGMKGSHIAVIGETSIEWIMLYLAVISGCGVLVPIDKELDIETLANQIRHADVEYIFCSDKCRAKVEEAVTECEKVQKIYRLESDDMPKIYTESEEIPIDPDETCMIIYTSGTTGANKGVMLSNRNIMGTLRGCARLLRYPETSFSVLPVNHSYELHAHLMSSIYCGTTVYINDDLKHLVRNLKRCAPEMVCMVPMMLDLLVNKIQKEIKISGKEKKFHRGRRLSKALRRIRIDRRSTIFSEVRQVFGGNLKIIICGGAALKQETADFLNDIGIDVYNGYGITECSPVIAVNPMSHAKRDSVGHILPTVKMRVVDKDADGIGELQILGENVMKGYYRAAEDTTKVFTDDGWFKTGDLGYVDKDNYVYLKGRLKNLIILSNGKNVTPEDIELKLEKHIPYIKECIVYADDNMPGLSVIINMDADFCRKEGLTTLQMQKEYIQKDVNSFNAKMPGYKRITNIVIQEKEFEKNTTHKIQRFKVLK